MYNLLFAQILKHMNNPYGYGGWKITSLIKEQKPTGFWYTEVSTCAECNQSYIVYIGEDVYMDNLATSRKNSEKI